MKIFILFPFKDGPWGGGNQFLKSLRDSFAKKGMLARSVEEADVLLCNSHHDLGIALRYKRNFPHLYVVHRIDGPLFYTRGGWKNKLLDRLIASFSNRVADMTITQSSWSKKKNTEFGYVSKPSDTTISNGVDQTVFYKKAPRPLGSKIRLVATSWSANWNKGFDVYAYVDKQLDMNRFEFVFIGNSPIQFERGRQVPPLAGTALAEELRKSDIYITASKYDPCSNGLLEALSSGLPVMVRNSGGHPELIGRGGVVFEGTDDALQKIEELVKRYTEFEAHIPFVDIDHASSAYARACEEMKKNLTRVISWYTVLGMRFWNAVVNLVTR